MTTSVRENWVHKEWVDFVFYGAALLAIVGAFRWQWWHQLMGNLCMASSGAPSNVGSPPFECGVESLRDPRWAEECERCIGQAWSLLWLSTFLAGVVLVLSGLGWLLNRGQLPGKPGPPWIG